MSALQELESCGQIYHILTHSGTPWSTHKRRNAYVSTRMLPYGAAHGHSPSLSHGGQQRGGMDGTRERVVSTSQGGTSGTGHGVLVDYKM